MTDLLDMPDTSHAMLVRITLRPDGRFNLRGIVADETVLEAYALDDLTSVLAYLVSNAPSGLVDMIPVLDIQ